MTPIISINGLPVSTRVVGPVSRRLRKIYFDVVEGRVPDDPKWRVPFYQRSPAKAEVH
jgi:hypothetical protein